MRIAIPVTANLLAQHFGHCERFLFLDVDPGTKVLTTAREEPAPPHAPGLLPQWLSERGTEVDLAGALKTGTNKCHH